MTADHRRVASAAGSALAFAAAGALSRYELRLLETRYQIAVFVVAAAGVELVAAATRSARPSWLRGFANAAAATLVIVTVKFHLEPAARARDIAIVRRVARHVATSARGAR